MKRLKQFFLDIVLIILLFFVLRKLIILNIACMIGCYYDIYYDKRIIIENLPWWLIITVPGMIIITWLFIKMIKKVKKSWKNLKSLLEELEKQK